MKPRKEAVSLIRKHLEKGLHVSEKECHHYGRVELRMLLDFLYGGPPKHDDEKIPNWKGEI
jgi:hypothetical protein